VTETFNDSGRDIVVIHSSDLHIDDTTARVGANDGLANLTAVLTVARQLAAHVILLAGDTFESHRLPQLLIDRAAAAFAATDIPIVLLPGNHDPAIAEVVYHQAPLRTLDHLHVLGVTCADGVLFPDLDLEIWGRPHVDYADMVPFEKIRPRRTRWQIAMGHGHYEPAPDPTRRPRPSWLISDAHIAATGADYVALGHWNRPAKVGNSVPAFYSGSPDYAGTVNVVRLTTGGDVLVTRAPLTPHTAGTGATHFRGGLP
jgi:DNA repair exonuclease SbcCD nuclease subunit